MWPLRSSLIKKKKSKISPGRDLEKDDPGDSKERGLCVLRREKSGKISLDHLRGL